MPEWMQMVHPEIDGEVEPATVTREAFEVTWKDKGWEEYTDPTTTAATRPAARPAATTERTEA